MDRQDVVSLAIDEARDELIRISLDIHDQPEVAFQEFRAADLLAGSLERHGFTVERGVGGLATAFRGTVKGGGGEGPTVAILAEYDALPDVGHGCGHNLLGMCALAAGVGAQSIISSLPGTLVVLGTPAEEDGGGKIRLLEAGAFEGVDVALSVHPSSNRTAITTEAEPGDARGLARVGYRYNFYGKAAHASGAPHQGINALNAVIHLFTGIDALRQHVRDDVRIHGVITDGGKVPNVVPDYASAYFYLRSRDDDYLREVVAKVAMIAEGAALITGARVEVIEADPLYETVLPNPPLASTLKRHCETLGIRLDPPIPPGRPIGGASTDFGNVSRRMPSFAVSYGVSNDIFPLHSEEMARAAATPLAQERTLAIAKAVALTACDVLADPELLAAARSEFARLSGLAK
jgi:amidohydrolase